MIITEFVCLFVQYGWADWVMQLCFLLLSNWTATSTIFRGGPILKKSGYLTTSPCFARGPWGKMSTLFREMSANQVRKVHSFSHVWLPAVGNSFTDNWSLAWCIWATSTAKQIIVLFSVMQITCHCYAVSGTHKLVENNCYALDMRHISCIFISYISDA